MVESTWQRTRTASSSTPDANTTPKKQRKQKKPKDMALDYQQRAVQIAAESMTALFAAPERSSAASSTSASSTSSCASPTSLSGYVSTPHDEGTPRPTIHKKRALSVAEKVDEGDRWMTSAGNTASSMSQEVAGGNTCKSENASKKKQRGSGSEDLGESDGVGSNSSSGGEQNKEQAQQKPKRKIRIRKPTYAVRKVSCRSLSATRCFSGTDSVLCVCVLCRKSEMCC